MRKRHPMRFIDRILEFFDIGDHCECSISYEDDVWRTGFWKSIFSRWGEGSTHIGCRQRNVLNGNHTIPKQIGIGERFLCNWCAKYHKKENDEFREERLKYLENLDDYDRDLAARDFL